MATTYTIPNRPVGTDPRSISEMLANFDEVLAALNSYDGANIRARSIATSSLAENAVVRTASVIRGRLEEVAVATGFVPEMTLTNIATGSTSLVLMTFEATIRSEGGITMYIQDRLDGSVQRRIELEFTGVIPISMVNTYALVSAGHEVRIFASVSAGRARWVSTQRQLTTIEFKK